MMLNKNISGYILTGIFLFLLFGSPAYSAENDCSSQKVNSQSLIKTYHLLDLTDGFGV
jgi:hypothetical protein